MAEKNYSKIKDIKSHLYNRQDTVSEHQIEGILHKVNYKTVPDWSKEDELESQEKKDKLKKSKTKTSISKKFFIGAIIFFLASLGFAFYKFSNGGDSVSNKNINITVLGNAFTKGGDELSLEIEIINRNNVNLELANLMVSYPNGASNNIADVVRLPRDSIGTIKPGQKIIRSIKVKLFGKEKSIRNVNIRLEYHPGKSNAIFTKEKIYPITISSAPLSLFINAPDKETSDQDFSFQVKAVLNTSLPKGSNTILKLSYPNNFVFESAVPEPTFSNSTWSLSSLSTTNPVTIIVNGRLVGQNGDQQIFHAYAGSANPNNRSVINVVYNSLLHSILIEKPFLGAKILVNNQNLPIYTVSSGKSISAQILWVNNLSTLITDAQIIVKISGNMLDKTSINPGSGFYDSANNQIIWDKNTVPGLSAIEPGGTGNLNFKFKSITLIGNTNQMKDPQITISVSIRGKQPNFGSTFSDINNFSSKIIKILSNFQIASSASYYSGPLPPKAENETKYVVAWTLSNTSNIITGAQAKSTLPIYINWVGSLAGTNEKISYNKTTREVTWDIGTVKSNVGFEGSNREVSFMVSFKPSLSQVGSVPQLMKAITLSGTDSFAGVPIRSKYGAITTLLLNDSNFKQGDQRVVQ